MQNSFKTELDVSTELTADLLRASEWGGSHHLCPCAGGGEATEGRRSGSEFQGPGLMFWGLFGSPPR